jgi:hypothetical protein
MLTLCCGTIKNQIGTEYGTTNSSSKNEKDKRNYH